MLRSPPASRGCCPQLLMINVEAIIINIHPLSIGITMHVRPRPKRFVQPVHVYLDPTGARYELHKVNTYPLSLKNGCADRYMGPTVRGEQQFKSYTRLLSFDSVKILIGITTTCKVAQLLGYCERVSCCLVFVYAWCGGIGTT